MGVTQLIEVSVVDCAIDSVVVYRDRAEVRRAVVVSLVPGDNEVLVSDLAKTIDKNSIRVEGKGDAVITDVIYSSKTTSEEVESSTGSKQKYEALKAQVTEYHVEIKHCEFRMEVLEKEKEFLSIYADHISTIHSMKDDKDTLSQLVHADNVEAVMDFFEKYESKITELDARLSALSQDKAKISEKISVLLANIDKINPNRKSSSLKTIRAIHVGLEAPVETEVVLYLSYVVRNASWSSSYDVRVFTKDKAMKIQYYGLIKQQTGEDWENTKISLSTAQPSVGGSAPSLPTRIIRFKRQQLFLKTRSAKSGPYLRASLASFTPEDPYTCTISSPLGAGLERGGGGGGALSPPAPPPPVETVVAKVKEGLFNTTYAIPRSTTIPADNTEHRVTVALVDLSPEFHYTSVPRLSPHSFLQAKAKNTSPYTILAGPANIFLDNNFIAKSELSDVSPNEEFTTSLGVDQSLRITCQPIGVVHNTRTGLLGGNKSSSITYTHQFLVKNTKSHSVDIHLSEQVPLSTDERIKVNVVNPEVHKAQVRCPLPRGYAILNDSNNLDWHVSVEGGEELELKLLYTVEHPAQDHVQGLPK